MRSMEGTKLRAELNSRGYPVKHFARDMGVNEVTAHRWLNGSTPINRVVELACEALFRKRDIREVDPMAESGKVGFKIVTVADAVG